MITTTRQAHLVAVLRDHGCRITPQRLAILDAFAGSDQHPTVDQVYQQVRRDFPTTSLATVYKTIGLLAELGEAVELAGKGESAHYDVRSPDPHSHLVCRQCGRIVDIEEADLSSVIDQARAESGFVQVDDQVLLQGLCAACEASSISQ